VCVWNPLQADRQVPVLCVAWRLSVAFMIDGLVEQKPTRILQRTDQRSGMNGQDTPGPGVTIAGERRRVAGKSSISEVTPSGLTYRPWVLESFFRTFWPATWGNS
jgi:hypothetical protein